MLGQTAPRDQTALKFSSMRTSFPSAFTAVTAADGSPFNMAAPPRSAITNTAMLIYEQGEATNR